VTDAEIAELHPHVPDWDIVELGGIKRLRRVFSVDDFAQALEFTKKVGELAEEEGHHPALTEWAGRRSRSGRTQSGCGVRKFDRVVDGLVPDRANVSAATTQPYRFGSPGGLHRQACALTLAQSHTLHEAGERADP
jgi:4a-hydroxytetrahydrobiopterin dehydratase